MKLLIPVQERNGVDRPKTIAMKMLYAAADFTRVASEWVRETEHRHERVDLPLVKSGLNFAETGYAKNEAESLGYMLNMGNDVQNNAQGVSLASLAFSKAHGLHLYPDNFLRAMALFGARKVTKHVWWNDTDEYCAPTPEVESSLEFEEFALDSLVYALFHSANNCTSVRDLQFKGKKINIPNHMFWKSHSVVRGFADVNRNQAMYNDLREVTDDSYVCKVLQVNRVSPEAYELLSAVNDLFDESMKTRAMYSNAHPELYLDAFDAGFYQLKGFWKEMYPEEFIKIKRLHKALEDKMRPWVYELGFLRTYEGMGLQTGKARDMFDKLIAGESSISKDVKTNDFDPCSVCGGSGCAFCHDTGSREEFLFRAITGQE